MIRKAIALILLSSAFLMAADERIPFTEEQKQEFTRLVNKAQAYDRALSIVIQDFIAKDPTAKQINADLQATNTELNGYVKSVVDQHEGYQLDLKDMREPALVKISK